MKDLSIVCENVPEAVRLTCIIPARATRRRPGVIERLRFPLLDAQRPAQVGFLVVDDGSDEASAAAIRELCKRQGFGYLRLNTELNEFSVGRCRNYGAMYARSKYVLMHDADLMPYDGLYQSILQEVDVQGLEANARDFLMFGCVYLTEAATAGYAATEGALRRQRFLNYALVNDPVKIEKISTGTSINLYNREYYLARGGNSPDFEGWGFEDLEFNARCIRLSNRFPTPRDWLADRKNFATILDYSGWKAVYRLFGDMTFGKGITLFHAWHPVDGKGDYMQRQEQNRRLFAAKMAEFARFGTEPDPLPSKMEGRTLLFRMNSFVFHREIRPRLGDIVMVQEDMFPSADEFEAFVRAEGITRVMFHNPYQNDLMASLYKRCREAGIPLVVGERGALRDSLFFDHSGFLADSDSYARHKWDRPLTQAERDSVLEFILNEKATDSCLEAQGKRVSAGALKRSLRIPAHKKVLFLTLQRPGDTVTRHFCGQMGTYANFIAMVGEVAKLLPWNWTLVVKKHPLEDECPDFDGAVAAHSANVKDLIEMSDALLTFNSGTGVLGMVWGKPVLHAGDAFYGHEGLNLRASSAEAVVAALKVGFRPDGEAVLRFLNYLVNEFYSFGEFITRPVKLSDGTNMTATTDIRFHVIRGLGQHATPYVYRAKSEVGWESSLFDRYRFSEQQHLAQSKQAAPAPAVAQPVRAKAAAAVNAAQPPGAEMADRMALRKGSPLKRKLHKLIHSPRRFFADMRLVRGFQGT